MDIKANMEKALNSQINEELNSSYIYLSMTAFFENRNLPGFAHWMKKQAGEELEHAMKIFGYINDRGGKVTLELLPKPKSGWKNPLEAFEDALKHEQHITDCIHNLVALSQKENDQATASFLTWFINEQVEEEKNAREIVDMLKMIGESQNGIFMLDHRLGKRE